MDQTCPDCGMFPAHITVSEFNLPGGARFGYTCRDCGDYWEDEVDPIHPTIDANIVPPYESNIGLSGDEETSA